MGGGHDEKWVAEMKRSYDERWSMVKVKLKKIFSLTKGVIKKPGSIPAKRKKLSKK